MSGINITLSGLRDGGAKTASFTAVRENFYRVDMSGASGDFTVTAPASPSEGDRFGYILSRAHASHVLLFGRNSSNVMGGTDADPYLLYQQNEAVIWRYDSTSSGAGWFLDAGGDGRIPGLCWMERSTTQTAIPNNTYTKIASLAAVVNRGGLADGTNSRMILRRKNRYNLFGNIGITDLGADKGMTFAVYKNAAALIFAPFVATPLTTTATCQGSFPNQALTHDDILELYVYHNHGSNRDMYQGAGERTALSAQEVL